MKTIACLAAGAFAVIACHSNQPKAPVEGVTTTGAGVVANHDAAMRLTNASCERAERCNRFGKDKDYADMAGCTSEVGHDNESDYRAEKCPHGVKEDRLVTCLNEIKNSACGNVGDKIRRAEACRTGELCID